MIWLLGFQCCWLDPAFFASRGTTGTFFYWFLSAIVPPPWGLVPTSKHLLLCFILTSSAPLWISSSKWVLLLGGSSLPSRLTVITHNSFIGKGSPTSSEFVTVFGSGTGTSTFERFIVMEWAWTKSWHSCFPFLPLITLRTLPSQCPTTWPVSNFMAESLSRAMSRSEKNWNWLRVKDLESEYLGLYLTWGGGILGKFFNLSESQYLCLKNLDCRLSLKEL